MRRFVTPPESASTGEADEVQDSGSFAAAGREKPKLLGPGALTRASITWSAAFGVGALLVGVLTAGFTPSGPVVSPAAERQATQIKEQTKTAVKLREGLPTGADAERAVIAAQTAAADVARLQNEYRFLVKPVQQNRGKLDHAVGTQIQRNLVPLFASEVPETALGPWYLLASDAGVPEGIGLPMSFDAGFIWRAQAGQVITASGTVQVTWVAVQTRVARGAQPQVLAWANAAFDPQRKSFTDLEVSLTPLGAEEQQEVVI